jgi:hypothetical protein
MNAVPDDMYIFSNSTNGVSTINHLAGIGLPRGEIDGVRIIIADPSPRTEKAILLHWDPHIGMTQTVWVLAYCELAIPNEELGEERFRALFCFNGTDEQPEWKLLWKPSKLGEFCTLKWNNWGKHKVRLEVSYTFMKL